MLSTHLPWSTIVSTDDLQDQRSFQDESIEASLVKTIASSDFAELTSDLLDNVLDELPLPVFSSLRKFYRGVRSVQNYFYTKKVYRYLCELRDIPPAQRQQRLEQLLDTPEKKEKFGEHIILVLDRLNDVEKARLMGRATRALLEDRIDVDKLKSLDFVIDAIDLRLLPVLKGDRFASDDDNQSLARCGLANIHLDIRTERIEIVGDFMSSSLNSSQEVLKSARLEYEQTDLARMFVEICLK